jgi:hypothetical protein
MATGSNNHSSGLAKNFLGKALKTNVLTYKKLSSARASPSSSIF